MIRSGPPLEEAETTSPATREFRTTHWSVVLDATADRPEAVVALEKLCRVYWYPIYARMRRKGVDPSEAQDFTQSFFERLLEKGVLRSADPSKGRFRTFLLTVLDHLVANEWRRRSTLKRGGAQSLFSLDGLSAEDRYRHEPLGEEPPDRLFERRWALAVLEQAMTRLESECAAAGKSELFQTCQPLLCGDPPQQTQAEMARTLRMTPNALYLTILRLRRRYGALIRAEIAATVTHPDEVEDELRHLMACLRPGGSTHH